MITVFSTPCDHRRSRACPAIVGPGTLWVQVAALLPARQVHHPLGCHRPASPTDWSSTSSSRAWCSAAATAGSPDAICSATTLRRRRDEWISAGLAEQLRLLVLAADDRLVGLELEQLAVDRCATKAPCGGQVAGPSPSTAANRD
jgi:transposase